ncbi:AAA family ATPase [Microbacterium sp. W1N]|uniref:AAA family ATPase n=1 Tax=Microbacterium festucae TaxID=2977531 RepID=UPI0021C0A880|nr:AAA family ATPase [Microbacterium festucae]MCT9820026.1 AAA family ATPase [Microbacterium festucae]
MLTADDPLPQPLSRVLISGTTGVGKSTLARRLAAAWNLPYTELDSLYHGPDWTPRPQFVDDVRQIAAGDRWVSEWNYLSTDAGALLGGRAQLLVWLDLPRRIAWPRLLRRTVRRSVRREPLWNGNVEPPLRTIFTDDEHILRWEARTHRSWRERMPALQRTYPHLVVVRLRHPREVRRWLAAHGA